MLKRTLILVALVATVALPFILRPKRTTLQAADDTVIVITPHNEAIRTEFALGFKSWYHARTGRTVLVDWRVIGGTSDITRFLESEYTAAFRRRWTGPLDREWSAEIQAGYVNPALRSDAPAAVREARAQFLASDVSCGIDVFCGGGSYDFIRQADAGRLIAVPLLARHPDWFTDDVLPQRYSGETYWDAGGRWYGNVLSTYGILYNRDAIARLGLAHPPERWDDLQDPKLAGELGLADPTKSSSIAKAFENLIPQKIQLRLTAPGPGPADRAQAVRDGWRDGLRLIQRIGANARYFTDSSQKPPIDVSQGDCAAGIAIDFYGRAQAEVTDHRTAGPPRVVFVTPRGGSVSSVDPIALLRGAPHRAVAELFIEYTLTMEAQKLWNFRPGTPGGTQRFALRRMPVRKDFYTHAEWRPYRSDPDDSPFGDTEHLVYHPEWTGGLFREMAFVIRILCLDTHDELAVAWREIIKAGLPADAVAVLGDMSAVDYDCMAGIKRRLDSKDKVDELRLANELAEHFRAQYRRAAELARAHAVPVR